MPHEPLITYKFSTNFMSRHDFPKKKKHPINPSQIISVEILLSCLVDKEAECISLPAICFHPFLPTGMMPVKNVWWISHQVSYFVNPFLSLNHFPFLSLFTAFLFTPIPTFSGSTIPATLPPARRSPSSSALVWQEEDGAEQRRACAMRQLSSRISTESTWQACEGETCRNVRLERRAAGWGSRASSRAAGYENQGWL